MGSHTDHGHDDHSHGHQDHDHAHGRGHSADQGIAGALRYLRHAPRMWTSDVNNAVVDLVAPRRGETVVDIGAGMGPAAMRAATRGASVIAVEPTPFMRTVVGMRSRFSRNRKRISVADGTAEALPVGDGEAHAIWAVNTMHHWADPVRGAAEIARVLRPGGRAVLVDENFADATHPDSAAWLERHDGDDGHGFSMVDATQIGGHLTQAGLTQVIAEGRTVANRPALVITATSPL